LEELGQDHMTGILLIYLSQTFNN